MIVDMQCMGAHEHFTRAPGLHIDLLVYDRFTFLAWGGLLAMIRDTCHAMSAWPRSAYFL